MEDERKLREYVGDLEIRLRKHANAAAAGPIEAYLKNQFPFLGIKAPERVQLTRQFVAEHGLPPGAALERTVFALWELPEREFAYTAMFFLEKRMKRAEPERIGLYERLIVARSWWDTVDLLASRLVGALFAEHRNLAEPYARRWIESDNLWLRRSAILFQLGYKERTDRDLLFDLIRRCAGESEFFIRKAIGWALRQYAKTEPDAVRSFVERTELSPLSRREALKHIGAGG
jgi:3-methyladenine DNA glycosylase AlkD